MVSFKLDESGEAKSAEKEGSGANGCKRSELDSGGTREENRRLSQLGKQGNLNALTAAPMLKKQARSIRKSMKKKVQTLNMALSSNDLVAKGLKIPSYGRQMPSSQKCGTV